MKPTRLPTFYRWRFLFARHLNVRAKLEPIIGWAACIAIAGMAAIGVLGN